MDNFKKICERLNKILAFDVELVKACGELYLCVFHDKSSNEDANAIYEISQVAHVVEAVVSKYYADVCVLGKVSINVGEHSPVNCTFRLSKPLLTKEELKLQFGIDCNWDNEGSCVNQDCCIDLGECVYLQEWEDRCL